MGTMTKATKSAPDGRQNMTITTYPEDRKVLSEIIALSGEGAGPSEVVRRALRVYRMQLLEEAAREAELRAKAGGEGGGS